MEQILVYPIKYVIDGAAYTDNMVCVVSDNVYNNFFGRKSISFSGTTSDIISQMTALNLPSIVISAFKECTFHSAFKISSLIPENFKPYIEQAYVSADALLRDMMNVKIIRNYLRISTLDDIMRPATGDNPNTITNFTDIRYNDNLIPDSVISLYSTYVNSDGYSVTLGGGVGTASTRENRIGIYNAISATTGGWKVRFSMLILPEQAVTENGVNISNFRIGYIELYGVHIAYEFPSHIQTASLSQSAAFNKIPPTPGGGNPYEPGGTSGTGGGNGTFDRTSDPVDFTPLPELSAARAGLISLFNPSLSELNELSSRLWSKDFLDAITNFFTDPSDIIISLGIVPVQPPISGRADLQAGLISTGMSMNVISSQFISYDCGTLELKPFYDAALDYSPYTKISIYLPYIGVRQLNTDEVMNNTVALRYNIDLFSGACVAEVKVGNSVLYTFNGNVVSQVPISARSYDSLISAVIQGATAIGGAIATGGATAGSALSATVNVVQSAKPEVLRSGNASANIGLLAGQIPYLIFEIPNQSMPENNQTFVGFPANITATLSDLSGYTQVDTVHLENIPATSSELSEIENLLKGGIIL